MGGGTMQLSYYGIQDVYLTGNPQITFFRAVYRRHTNFSMESIIQTKNNNPNFGDTTEVVIRRTGDLITKMWAQIKLPAANIDTVFTTQTDPVPPDRYRTWTNSVGLALIKTCELSIGGQLIDKHYREWYDIWNELTDPNQKLWSLIGKKESVAATNTDNITRYYVPFKFWFNNHYGLALPLISLQYHDIKLKIELETLAALVLTNDDVDTTPGTITEFDIYVDYIYLDTEERRRFAMKPQEYLIEQLQYHTTQVTTGTNSIVLNFNHPVKSLYWVIQNNNRISIDTKPEVNTTLTGENGNDWFHYSSITENATLGLSTFDTFNTATLLFNGNNRFSDRDARYFTDLQPYEYHSNVPSKHIYMYSFCLKPEEYQPSGVCNFSRIDDIKLELTGCKAGTARVYALSYNIFRIDSGMGQLLYAN